MTDLEKLIDTNKHYGGLLPNQGCSYCGKGDMMVIGSVSTSEMVRQVVACKHCRQFMVYDEPLPSGELMLDIITPCSRPENLRKIYPSILALEIPVRWHIIMDTAHQNEEMELFSYDASRVVVELYRDNNPIVSPGRMRNMALRNIPADYRRWIYCLDDDNIMHPRAGDVLREAVANTPLWAFLVSCETENGVLETGPEVMGVGKVDMAQLFVNSCLLCGPGGVYFSEWGREEDGVLITKLSILHKSRMGFIKEVVAYHDGLRSIDD